MDREVLRELVMLVLGVLLGSILGHLLSRRRFLQERKWERQAAAYDKVIGGLVNMMRSLNLWTEREYSGVYSQESLNVITREFNKARDEIEYAVIGGEHIISKKASNALSDLMEKFESISHEFASSPDWVGCLETYHGEVKSCLEIIRAEARSVLGVPTDGK